MKYTLFKVIILLFSMTQPGVMRATGDSIDRQAQAGSVSLIDQGRGRGALYQITGVFEVSAPRSQVWNVLTDYSALKGVVSSMQASCVVKRDGNTVFVDQVALGRFLFFKKTINLRLRVEEEPENLLRFTETSGKPFRVYNGSWTLEDNGDRIMVTYLLNVSQADMAPPVIERGLFKNNALSLLKELKAEIVRRAELLAISGRNARS